MQVLDTHVSAVVGMYVRTRDVNSLAFKVKSQKKQRRGVGQSWKVGAWSPCLPTSLAPTVNVIQ